MFGKTPIVKTSNKLDEDESNVELIFNCMNRRLSKLNYKYSGAQTPSKASPSQDLMSYQCD